MVSSNVGSKAVLGQKEPCIKKHKFEKVIIW